MVYFVFTDGGCNGNGGKNPVASYAYVVFKDSVEVHRDSGIVVKGEYGDEKPSNNRGELTAILHALRYIKDNNLTNVTLYSDSLISVNTINSWYQKWVDTNKLSKHANIILIKSIMSLYDKSIKVVHCRAHQAEPNDKKSHEYLVWKGNDICDKSCLDVLFEISE